MKKKEYLEMKKLLDEFKQLKKPFDPHMACKQYQFIFTLGFRVLFKTKGPDETMEDIARKAFNLFIDVSFLSNGEPIEQIVEDHLRDRYSVNGMISGPKKVAFH
jgi:hypothetical protein